MSTNLRDSFGTNLNEDDFDQNRNHGSTNIASPVFQMVGGRSSSEKLIDTVKEHVNQMYKHFKSLNTLHQTILVLLGLASGIFGILLLVFHNSILHKLVEISNTLRTKNSTQFIIFWALFIISFPPMLGYSFTSTATGLIYGVSFHGWIILASGTILGSISAFVVFQKILIERSKHLIKMNKKFEAFAMILQQNNSYWFLALFRLCPFPYSLTNGALASIYGVSVKNFAIANIITSPKLVMYLFIGSRIKHLGDDSNTGNSKLFDICSIFITVFILSLTAWVLYNKTQQKYLQLQNASEEANMEIPAANSSDIHNATTNQNDSLTIK